VADIEKTIKELKDGLDFKIFDNTCVLLEVSTVSDVLELLKKQQKQIEEYEIQMGGLKERLEMSGLSGVPILQCYGSDNHICPNCSLVLDEVRDAYCPSCGMEMRWSEVDDDD